MTEQKEQKREVFTDNVSAHVSLYAEVTESGHVLLTLGKQTFGISGVTFRDLIQFISKEYAKREKKPE